MSKIKSSAEQIFMLGGIEDSDKDFFRKHGKLSFVDVVKLLNYAKKQAIEATLEVAARDAETHTPMENDFNPCIDTNSILSLISSEDLKVE